MDVAKPNIFKSNLKTFPNNQPMSLPSKTSKNPPLSGANQRLSKQPVESDTQSFSPKITKFTPWGKTSMANAESTMKKDLPCTNQLKYTSPKTKKS